eukprot:6945823-Pyramimonas_sp.AAC.1
MPFRCCPGRDVLSRVQTLEVESRSNDEGKPLKFLGGMRASLLGPGSAIYTNEANIRELHRVRLRRSISPTGARTIRR